MHNRQTVCSSSVAHPFTHPPAPPPCSFRHLMLDLGQLLPHGKKDAKLDTKSERGVINEVADMKVRVGGVGEGAVEGEGCGRVWKRLLLDATALAGRGMLRRSSCCWPLGAASCWVLGAATAPLSFLTGRASLGLDSTQGCTSVLYFEARKHKDLYLWVAKAPQGPSVKFHVTNGGWGGREGGGEGGRGGGGKGGREGGRELDGEEG